MYMAASSQQEMEEWMKALRQGEGMHDIVPSKLSMCSLPMI